MKSLARPIVFAALAVLAILFAPAPLAAQTGNIGPTAETLFADASAKESAVRRALAGRNPTPTVLRAVRTVVHDYETLVRLYPTSGYCDDALWRAALLSNDAFRIFSDGRERAAAVRMLQALASEYPTSKFARQGPALVAELNSLPVRTTTSDSDEDGEVAAKPAATSPGATPIATANIQPAARPTSATAPAPTKGAVPDVAKVSAARASSTAPSTSRSAAVPKIATIQDIRRVVLPDVVRVIVELDREVTFRDERLERPTRVFVDLPATTTIARLRDQTVRFDEDTDLVRQVRIGRHPNNTTRVVLDATDVTSYSVYPLYNPFRLVIDCVRTPPAAERPQPAIRTPVAPATTSAPVVPTPPRVIVSPPAAPAAAATSNGAPPRMAPFLVPRRMTSWGAMPVGPGSSELAIRESQVVPPLDAKVPRQLIQVPVRPAKTSLETLIEPGPAVAAVEREAVLPSAIAPPSRNLDGGLSLARQLGMGISRIVIDPGHGGHDPGTKGGGNNEAEVVLDVALRLETLLRNQSGVDVVLTRRGNSFVSLQERTAIANRENADLFLSIHANASNVASAHGVETYFLNFASNLNAAAVAARENAASGQLMNELPDVVKAIALNNKLDESKDFATHVQRELVARLRPSNRGLRDLGVKQAPFQVLIGAAMPSVLAEISFLTNAQESRLLKQTSYRQKIAEALYNAIQKYQSSLSVSTLVRRPS